ncbi:hypothetical protein ABT392_13595 [Paucibacter sp. JuS9]|uniref:hypothetical protein n=1 Tax=Roseateles TaxID=93681 RepID=UPI002FE50280
MGELLSELRKADRVVEAQRIGGQECVELLACGEQGPGLRMGVAMDPPGPTCRHAGRHSDQAEPGSGRDMLREFPRVFSGD